MNKDDLWVALDEALTAFAFTAGEAAETRGEALYPLLEKLSQRRSAVFDAVKALLRHNYEVPVVRESDMTGNWYEGIK